MRHQSFRPLALLVIVCSTLVPWLTGATAASAQEAAGALERIAGIDAIGTAIAVSQAQFLAGQAGAVVLARSDHFADALAGGPLAAARRAPLLITPGTPVSSALDGRVATEIGRVLPAGNTVYVLGGPLALSPAIDTILRGSGYTVTRLQGNTQYGTAVTIAGALGNPATIFEATGLHFADALAAVPAVVQQRGAILLTAGAQQAPETASYLVDHPPVTRYAVGGPLAAAGADPSAIPVFGNDLFATSAAVADRFFGPDTAYGVTTGRDFPDALAGGVLMGARQGPMLLVDTNAPVPASVQVYFQARSSTADGVVFGGPLAVPDAVVGAIPAPLPDPPGGQAAAPIQVTVPSRGGASIAIDFPDPSITYVADAPAGPGGTPAGPAYYAYSTNAADVVTPVLRSPDLVHWTLLGDAFGGQERSAWATLSGGFTWAPSMLVRPTNPPDQRFVLYYTARSHASDSAGLQCIGRAVAARPEGPFTDTSSTPLVCMPDRGGSIDPDPVVANGVVYLLFQSFGIEGREATRIWSMQLRPDGLAPTAFPTELLSTWGWEKPVVEGPTMMPAPDGGFVLLYSARQWWTPDYATAAAWCPTPTSPCERLYRGPLLATRATMAGPGGPQAFQDASGVWQLAFHAWTAPFVGYPLFPDDRYGRSLRILPVTFPGGGRTPVIG